MIDLKDLITEVQDKAAELACDVCYTLDNPQNEMKWVQITAFSINLAYPLSTEPDLSGFPEGLGLLDWEAERFITLSYDFTGGDLTEETLATFIEAYAQTHFGSIDDWSLAFDIL